MMATATETSTTTNHENDGDTVDVDNALNHEISTEERKMDENEMELKKKETKKKKKKKKKKRKIQYRRFGCPSKLASIENLDSSNETKKKLPSNQYECTLKRRAIYQPKPPKQKVVVPPPSSTSRRNIFGIPLPIDQDTKNNNNNPPQSQPSQTSTKKEQEMEYVSGDVSLGMKLNIKQNKVVVTQVIPLVDGRASPAQLTGCITAGDILLAIDGVSLIDVPLNDLIASLKVLTVDNKNQPSFTILFQFGPTPPPPPIQKPPPPMNTSQYSPIGLVDQFTGLPLFPKQDPTTSTFIPPSTIQKKEQEESQPVIPDTNNENSSALIMMEREKQEEELFHKKMTAFLSQKNQQEKKRFQSQFFTLNTHCSILLRLSTTKTHDIPMRKRMTRQELLEFGTLALEGARIICIEMEQRAEETSTQNNKRKDPLAIIWSDGKSFSSRSRFSRMSNGGGFSIANSRLLAPVDDVTSESDSSDDDNSISSVIREEEDDEEEDELLIRLAAKDDEWKCDMIEALEKLSVKNREANMTKKGKQHTADKPKEEQQSIFQTLSNENFVEQELFSTILFGQENIEQMTKIMSNRTFALPPDEFTVVLYDLSMHVSSKHTLPKNIITFSPSKHYTNTLPFGNKHTMRQSPEHTEPSVYEDKNHDNLNNNNNKPLQNHTMNNYADQKFLNEYSLFINHPKANQDILVASTFLLKEAIPTWLQTFQPLSWKERRILWPATNNNKSTYNPDEDQDLTIASPQSTWTMNHSNNSRKNLEETIEDIEMHPESRNETCALVLFHFTRRVLVELVENRRTCTECKNDNGENEKVITNKNAIEFVQKYGSYLNLHESLTLCAKINYADDVIDELLKMADHDPCHREIMKKFKKDTILFYESNMLSALLLQIPIIATLKKDKQQQKEKMMYFLVAAYPDLRPWQVQKLCKQRHDKQTTQPPNDSSDKKDNGSHANNSDFYYEYLSMLLHPEEGSDSARQEPELVEEWCKLSVFQYLESPVHLGRSNFLTVASRNTMSDWREYHRDIPMLLELSITIDHSFQLSLKLAEEIIHHKKYRMDILVINRTLSHLKNISKNIIEKTSNLDENSVNLETLSEILRLIHDMGAINFNTDKSQKSEIINVSKEIKSLLETCKNVIAKDECESEMISEKELIFISLMVDTVAPRDTLLALEQWSESYPSPPNISLLMLLQKTLVNGAKEGLKNDVSGALFRLQHVRSSRPRTLPLSTNGMKSSTTVSSYFSNQKNNVDQMSTQALPVQSNGTIWSKLVDGTAIIEK